MENILRQGHYNIYAGSAAHRRELVHRFICNEVCVCSHIKYNLVCDCPQRYILQRQYYNRQGRITHVEKDNFCLHTWIDVVVRRKNIYFDKIRSNVLYSIVVGRTEIPIRTEYERTLVAAFIFEYENLAIFQNMSARSVERSIVERVSCLPKEVTDFICAFI